MVKVAINQPCHRRLSLIIWLGFGLRLVNLGRPSLWYDETVSAFLAGQTIPDLIGHTARDIHPPGYYLLLHFWQAWLGPSEFSLAFFSLIFGVLLIPATFRLALTLRSNRTAARWAALAVALSPYHLWYAQEVRMYTLAALLGLVAAWALWQGQRRPAQRRFWLAYILAAGLGLYILYYFAFLLLILNLFFIIRALGSLLKWRLIRPLLLANLMVLLIYWPWLPVAWRQATNPPVPPWRTPQSFAPVWLESWSALALGQSVAPGQVWPLLLLFLVLAGLGGYALYAGRGSPWPGLFLVAYTFGPLLLIQLLSLLTPLYHVRYIFTYAPPFSILLGWGLAWLAGRSRVGLVPVALILLAANTVSIYRYHTAPQYQPDDFRSAVRFIEARWQPGDAILINAGYTYPAYHYYSRDRAALQWQRLVPYPGPDEIEGRPLLLTGTVDGPASLGWADPRSDFYAMRRADTEAALARLTQDYHRLWVLRAYDTVSDPAGLIRTWLAEHAVPLEDQRFAGESNIRAQAFMLAKEAQLAGERVAFADGLALAGWTLPAPLWRPGQTIYLRLGWLATARPSLDYKMSLKLWAEDGRLAGQGQDTWPVATLYRARAWPLRQTIYQPVSFTLPADLAPGRYWLNVELYHPDTLQPLARLDGADPVVTLGPVDLGPE